MSCIPSGLRAFLVLAPTLLLGLACPPPADPLAELPPGLWLSGDAAALRRVLDRAALQQPLPIGREAAALRERIADCANVRGSAADGDWVTLLGSIACSTPSEELVAVQKLRGDADLALGAHLDRVRMLGRVHVAPDASLRFSARLDPGELGAAAALLLPSGDPVGAPRLNPQDTVLHGRFRPAGGLNIADLVPEGSQGDQLFRLKSELFAGAVLDGTWEVAVWMPEEASAMPPVAMALGHRLRGAAAAAVDKFVADLRENWPIHRRDTRFGGHEGGCLDDLRLLPELAPCWALTEDALVVGWNAASVDRALARGAGAGPGPSGGVVVHLARLPEADRRLQQALAPGAEPFGVDYGWSRLEARALPGEGTLDLEVELLREREGGPATEAVPGER